MTMGEHTDAKLHNAVQARGAVFMCWMIKQEEPEYKKPKEKLRAYSELAATKGKGHGLGPPGIAAFTGLLQALSERQHSGSGQRGWSGKPQANVGRHGTRGIGGKPVCTGSDPAAAWLQTGAGLCVSFILTPSEHEMKKKFDSQR